jgi:hypothetical protein
LAVFIDDLDATRDRINVKTDDRDDARRTASSSRRRVVAIASSARRIEPLPRL